MSICTPHIKRISPQALAWGVSSRFLVIVRNYLDIPISVFTAVGYHGFAAGHQVKQRVACADGAVAVGVQGVVSQVDHALMGFLAVAVP